MKYENKSKEELIIDIINLEETLKNISIDYNKVLLILEEIKECANNIKNKKGLFKVFYVAETAYDIVKILEKK